MVTMTIQKKQARSVGHLSPSIVLPSSHIPPAICASSPSHLPATLLIHPQSPSAVTTAPSAFPGKSR